MEKNMMIRNSTAEFLTFIAEGKEDGIQVLYKDESIWATQKAMSLLFDCSTDNIGLHLKNIYESGELEKERSVVIGKKKCSDFGKMKCSKIGNNGTVFSATRVQYYWQQCCSTGKGSDFLIYSFI